MTRTRTRIARLTSAVAAVIAATTSLAPAAGASVTKTDRGCTVTVRFIATAGDTVQGRASAQCRAVPGSLAQSVDHIVLKVMVRNKPTQEWRVGAKNTAHGSTADVAMPCVRGSQYRIRAAAYGRVTLLVKGPYGNYVPVTRVVSQPSVVAVTAGRWITCGVPIAGD
ncbi:MAG: hypothetical protein KatS3mg010_1154 [Acidimicrobiia bacterium]|nr:MAG: hypothetical protein KatS3mg010_1154 [Acidimicrobiia bacterium]